jgi:putative transposase
MILLGERSIRHVLANYTQHFHTERNHQGKGNAILFPSPPDRVGEKAGRICTRARLGGLLKFYHPPRGVHFTRRMTGESQVLQSPV